MKYEIKESQLMKIVSEEYDKLVKEGSIPVDERVVDKFTPYTPEEREQNFIPFTSKDKRTAFERNPSYERALKAAQERRRQKEMERESKTRVNSDDIAKAITEVLSLYETGKLNEDAYSYNGLDQQAQYRKMGEDLMAQQNKEKNYKKNIMLFKRAYNKIYKEYSVIAQLRRKNPNAKDIFNGPAFMKYVKEVEGDTLYNPIWEKYGGEYEEIADQYLQSNVIKLRKEMGI